MENLIFLLSASLVLYRSRKKLRTISLGDTGCSVKMYGIPDTVDFTRSSDGDALVYMEHHEGEITYGIVCATLKDHLDLAGAHEVMINYMDRLRKPFKAVHKIGVKPCPVTSAFMPFLKVVDYWQDDRGLDWHVKGYTNGGILAILYVRNINLAPVEKQELFLDSFQFPG